MKQSVNNEFGSNTDLFQNMQSTANANDMPRTMTLTKDAPEVNTDDMDSAMLSMLAMNQGGGGQQSINLGYQPIAQRVKEESVKQEEDGEYQVHMSGMQEKNFDNMDTLMAMRGR